MKWTGSSTVMAAGSHRMQMVSKQVCGWCGGYDGCDSDADSDHSDC